MIMSKRKASKVPQIRFRGHIEEWEEKTIGSILAEVKRTIVLEDSQKYELITVKRRNDGIVSRGCLFGRDILVKNYSQLKAGDFVISKRQVVHGATGRVPEHLDNAIVSNEYLVATDSKDISTEFLTILSSLPEMKKNFFLSSYGVDIEKLFFDVDAWKKRTIKIPLKPEQEIISSCLRELDQLLHQHQHKHDKLVTLKQAMLQKMFPQPGATKPEVRFKGFEEEWRREGLESLTSFAKGQGYSKGDLVASGTPIILYGRLYTNYETVISNVDTFVLEKKGVIKSKGREVIVPASGETAEDIARASAVTAEGIILGGDLNIVFPSKLLDPIFLALTLSSGSPQKELASKAQGKSVVHLRNADIKEINIPYPGLPEQKKIGAYFRQIDELIARHATQLEKLKQIKAACLEKMFF
jgi:type I restriction enzyme, S subunit